MKAAFLRLFRPATKSWLFIKTPVPVPLEFMPSWLASHYPGWEAEGIQVESGTVYARDHD